MELGFAAAMVLVPLALAAALVAALGLVVLIAALGPEETEGSPPPPAPLPARPAHDVGELFQMRTRLLALAAHDMRTPLGTIEGFSHLLSRAPEDRKAEYVSHIDRAVGSIRRLLGDLTDLGAIEAGRFRLSFASFDAGRLVRETAEGLLPAARAKGVRLSIEDVREGLIVQGDRFRLGQAVQNLAANALKFTPAGGKVSISAAVRDGWLEIAVADTGRGMSAAERERVFERFYQAPSLSPAEKSSGLGLGLSIARDIARGHGGRLSASSAGPGRGSTFLLRLPERRSIPALSLRGLAAALLLLAALPGVRAQTLPLAQRTAFERGLERKCEAILDEMFGPGQSRVVVEATLDFDRTEMVETHLETPPSPPKPKAAEPPPPEPTVLPGIVGPEAEPAPPAPPPQAAAESPKAVVRGWDRKIAYPSLYLKRLNVTVVANETLPLNRVEAAREVLTQALSLSIARGDQIRMVRAPFAESHPGAAESRALAGRLAELFLFVLAASTVVCLCFWRLTTVLASTARVAFAFPRREPARLSPPPGSPAPVAFPREADEGRAGAEASDDRDSFTLSVRPSQAPALAGMMLKEDPANVALVAAKLETEARAAFLDALPAELAGRVVVELSRPRFVDPESLARLKDELERRLRGMVGGPADVVETVERLGQGAKRAVLERLPLLDPDTALQLRRRSLLFEDLERLGAADWDLLAAAVDTEDWADALGGAPPWLAPRLREHLPSEAWTVIDRTSHAHRVSLEEAARARDRIVANAWSLVRERRIANPLSTEA